ncbi:carboxypeptidase regulatory-like domain-containing protein [Bacteroidales bacterium OttesenSCG-928-I14]|nr:carboxypeptidase regulatory-like domain-containing protein [Bacteroidales bacterium OttesenSCG-928-I14]
MKKNLLIRLVAGMIIFTFCAMPFYSSIKSEGEKKISQTEGDKALLGSIMDILYSKNIASDFSYPTAMFEHEGILYVSPGEVNASNPIGKMYKYKTSDLSANGSIVIPELSGGKQFCGFTTDGNNIYGVNETDDIFVIDPNTMEITSTITASGLFNAPTMIAYDKERKGFWVATTSETSIYFLDMTGEIVPEERIKIPYTSGISGLAYDDRTEGGPYLWFADGYTFYNQVAQIYRIDLATKTKSDVMKELKTIPGTEGGYNFGGPLYIYGDITLGKNVLTGIIPSGSNYETAVLYGLELEGYPLAATPDAVSEVVATPGANGALTVTLSWKNPTYTLGGTEMQALKNVKVYRDDETGVIKTYNAPAVGASMTFEDEVSAAKLYTYKIVAENTSGVGLESKVKVYIGQDKPLPVTNLVLTEEDGNARISWTAPTGGINGGYINFNNLKYNVVRLPDNADIASGISETTFLDETLPGLAYYSYVVTARTVTGYSEPTTSNELQIGDNLELPWEESFDEESSFKLWTKINTLGSNGTEWLYDKSTGNLAPSVNLNHSNKIGRDAWLISPPFNLEAGKAYRLLWEDRSSYWGAQSYEVTMGTAPTVVGQTSVLEKMDLPKDQGFTEKETIITITTAGSYYIGWHSKLPKATSTWGSDLHIDNIRLEEVSGIELDAVSLTGPSMPSVNRENVYHVTVKNWGGSTATGFEVSLIDESNQELAKLTYNDELLANAVTKVSIPWIPTEVGEKTIRGKVYIAEDIKPSNDITTGLSVNVQAQEFLGIEIGYGSEWERMPFDYYNSFSTIQTIYYEDEINAVGLIEAVKYTNNFQSGAVGERPIKIYMSITDKEDLSTSWETKEAVLVYDGVFNFEGGENSYTINLQKPFQYPGGNLLITTIRPDERYFGMFDLFKCSRSTEHPERTRKYSSNDKIDFDFTQTGVVSDIYANVILMTNANVGILSGVVTDKNGAIAGATLSVEGSNISVTTDNEGKYTCVAEAGSYNLIVSKLGYKTQTKAVTVAKGDNLTEDFTLLAIEGVKVSGEVKSESNIAVENAVIQLNGYNDYTTTTDSEGKFTIENVYVNEEYELSVEKSGYVKKGSSVAVLLSDIELPTIVLSSCNNPTVRDLSATADVYNVGLSWSHPKAIDGRYAEPLYAANDSVVTSVGAAINGLDWSEVYETDILAYKINKSMGVSIADDFVLSEDATVTDIDFYAFVESAKETSIGGVYVQIYDGKPGAGGQVIWGDLVTNRLEIDEYIGCYRVKEQSVAGLTDRNCSISRVKAGIYKTLTAGTYWIEVTFESSVATKEVLVVPCTAKGHRVEGNAMLNDLGTWIPAPALATMEGNLGLAFLVNGVPEGENYITNYKIYRDNTLVGMTPHFQYDYSNIVSGQGTYNYEVAAIWNNECESARASVSVTVEQNPCELAINDFPYYENFEDGLSSCWKHEILNGGDSWKIGQGTGTMQGTPTLAHSGTRNLRYSTIGNEDKARITMPMMDISELEKPYLSFYHAQNVWGSNQDILRIYYKKGVDGELVKLVEYTQNIAQWTHRVIELPAEAKSDELYIVFEGESHNGYGLLLDDIAVMDDGCYPVTDFTVQQVLEYVLLTWIEPGVPNTTYTLKRDGKVIASNLTADGYVDGNIEDGKTYEYCLQVDYKDKDCGDFEPVCANITVKIDECPPITDISIERLSVHSIIVRWEMEESEDIDYFVIGFDGTALGTVAGSSRDVGLNVTGVQPGYHDICVTARYKNRSCLNSEPICIRKWIGEGYDSIDEVSNEPEIKVYPNPVKDGYVKVEGENISKIDIMTIGGNLLGTNQCVEGEMEHTVYLTGYAEGVYLLKVYTLDGKSTIKKIIISK